MNRPGGLDIINTVIQAIRYTVEIRDYTNNGDGTHDLHVCNMHHAQPDYKVTIDGKEYKILDILAVDVPNCKKGNWDFMKIKGDANDIEVTSFELYRPAFFYATPIQQDVELGKINDRFEKTPMFWVNSGTLESELLYDEMSNDERYMNFEIYALTNSDHEKWVSPDFQKYAVRPMERMLTAFFNQIKSMPWLFDQYSLKFKSRQFQYWGVYIANKGFKDNLWRDKLSGAGSPSSTVTVLKDDNACIVCCEETPYIPDTEDSES